MQSSKQNKKYYTVLGLDPGKVNFAFSVVRFKLNPFRFRVMTCGVLQHPVGSLVGAEVTERFNAYKQEIQALKTRYNVDSVIAERFQTRGGSSMGTTIELISMMLALLTSPEFNFQRVQYITAAQWKNRWTQKRDLQALYKLVPMPAHPLDATGIALYGVSQQFPQVECFSVLNTDASYADLLAQIIFKYIRDMPNAETQKSTTSRTRRRRKRSTKATKENTSTNAKVQSTQRRCKATGRVSVR